MKLTTLQATVTLGPGGLDAVLSDGRRLHHPDALAMAELLLAQGVDADGIHMPDWRVGGIRIGQRVARDGLASKAHLIQPLGLGTKVDLDVAKRLAVGQLGKSHCQELVHAAEVLDLVVAAMLSNASAKSAQWQKRHELRKNELALVHGDPLRAEAKDHKSWSRRSNRDQTEMPKFQGTSLTCDVQA